MRYQQNLQVSLRERLRRLMVANLEDASHEVRLVAGWITDQPALRVILTEAERAEPGLDPDALVSALGQGGTGLARNFRWPSQTEGGRAVLVLQLMWQIAAEDADGTDSAQIVLNYAPAISSADFHGLWREFTERILRPLFDYLDERVGAESSVLYVTERYVRRVEWFDRDDLYARAMQDTRKTEEVYDADLRRFLFSEGINMPFSQARSASGLSDVLADLDSEDPLVCEVKIYDAAGVARSTLQRVLTRPSSTPATTASKSLTCLSSTCPASPSPFPARTRPGRPA